jgi:hypothetical protein
MSRSGLGPKQEDTIMLSIVLIVAVVACLASGLVLTLGIARQGHPGWPKRFTFLLGIADILVGVAVLVFFVAST